MPKWHQRAVALAALVTFPTIAVADEFRSDIEDAILFGKRMALYENPGGPGVRNYRYDRGHTAVGVCQMTDTTWREIAPSVGIDAAKIRTAEDASEHQQWQACWQLHVLRGYDPWTCCNTELRAALDPLARPSVALTAKTSGGREVPRRRFAQGKAVVSRATEQPPHDWDVFHDDEEPPSLPPVTGAAESSLPTTQVDGASTEQEAR